MTLVLVTDVLHPDSPASPVSLLAATAAPIWTPPAYVDPGPAGGAAVQPIATHNCVIISADGTNTAPVLLLFGTGTPSAANYHYSLAPGTSLVFSPGMSVLYRGPVQGFSTAAAKVGIAIF